ncbi:sulfotransferase family protein [Oxynema aestuarii]|uniref:Sulfotransferase n=1 Tax=Oxynema aestuarii AP17 TaxID=2064643 RepID=A0A6H1TT29_9CYAN|nr:sulfotransferase [Oxynema aestuarii]QIZ69366.1 sulfotransferase [Oxynema aestuarii AP17]
MKLSPISRIPKALLYKSFHFLNRKIHTLEVSGLGTTEIELVHPPIFIIGAPRSGSTLLYQVLTDYYDVGYISNLHAKFYGAPSTVERLFHPLKWRQSSDYTSYHGQTQGWLDPSECGEFWYRFFSRKPAYVPIEETNSEQIRHLRNSVIALLQAFGKPILFKNLYCSLRLQAIAKSLPESLFIVIHRNIIDNGHSLLAGRKKVYGDYKTWWSVEPPEVDKLKNLPAYEQVIEQIRSIYTLIERDKQIIGTERFLDLDYEEFCNNTHYVLNKISNFFDSHELMIKKRIDISKIPNEFLINQQINIDQSLYDKMLQYVQSTSLI